MTPDTLTQAGLGAAAILYLMFVVTPELRGIRKQLSNLSSLIARASGLDTRNHDTTHNT
jgi:hypothetical protein